MTRENRVSGVSESPHDVVIVEDDPDHLELLTNMLSSDAHFVRAYASAEEAHAAVLARPPDIVITDLQLGGVAGWTLAEMLRGDPRTSHIALVAVTGAVDPRREVVTHFDAYLPKPVDLEVLLGLVRNLASMSRAKRLQLKRAR